MLSTAWFGGRPGVTRAERDRLPAHGGGSWVARRSHLQVGAEVLVIPKSSQMQRRSWQKTFSPDKPPKGRFL